jgi:hypothetical protein
MNEQIMLLRDNKSRRKICKRINRDFSCKKIIGCSECPITIFSRVEYLSNTKNMTLGDAYRISIRTIHEEK